MTGLGERGARVSAGLLSLFFYACSAGSHLAGGEPQHMLWACHVANLAVGLGLLLRSPTLNGVGLLWVTIGVPAWLLYLAGGGAFRAVSLLTHLGGLGLGLFGARALGLPAGAWWKALLGLAGLQVLTRAVTPPRENVNLAFAVWEGWEPWFPSHGIYLSCLAALCVAVFLAVPWLLRRVGLAAPALAHGAEAR